MSLKGVSSFAVGIISLIFLVVSCSSPAAHSETRNTALPLLDTEVPAIVETASFALG